VVQVPRIAVDGLVVAQRRNNRAAFLAGVPPANPVIGAHAVGDLTGLRQTGRQLLLRRPASTWSIEVKYRFGR
jgi:hypothetical protein